MHSPLPTKINPSSLFVLPRHWLRRHLAVWFTYRGSHPEEKLTFSFPAAIYCNDLKPVSHLHRGFFLASTWEWQCMCQNCCEAVCNCLAVARKQFCCSGLPLLLSQSKGFSEMHTGCWTYLPIPPISYFLPLSHTNPLCSHGQFHFCFHIIHTWIEPLTRKKHMMLFFLRVA